MKKAKINMAFLLILAGAFLLRIFIIYSEYHGINSDNAILGLMAKHILKGEFPTFFYGQPYMGSPEAFLIAVFFLIFGVSVNTMCLTVSFITCLGIISAYFLGKELKDKTLGLYAMLLASLPPIYTFWHGLAASGGYPETLLFGNILFTIALKIKKAKDPRLKTRYYLIMGLVGGLAFWTHLVIGYYILPIAVFLFINENKKFFFLKVPILVVPSFFFGSLPLWIYNIRNDFDTFKLPVSKNLAEGFSHFLGTYPLLIADKPFSAFYYVLLSIYISSFLFLVIKPDGKSFFKSPRFLFLMLFLSIIYCFSSSHMARTHSAKYLVSMTTVIVISNAYLIWYLNKKIKYLGYIPLLYILFFNGADVSRSYLADKRGSYADHKLFLELMDFLDKNNLKTNYCTFWISQKLNFLSNEGIINANYEGDRYIPYEDIVEVSDNIAFIEIDSRLEPMFDMLCGNYSRTKVGPFFIYYNFSPIERSGRMIPNDKWAAESNYNSVDAKTAIDRNVDTYWGTILHKRKGMYFKLDMGSEYNIYKISMFNNGHWRNFPLNITLEISKDGKEWKKLDVPNFPSPLFIEGPRLYWHLQDGRIELVFPPEYARYIKIKQDLDDSLDPWEINELFAWEYTGDNAINPSEYSEICDYLSGSNITNIYADLWLSAKIHQSSNGKIRTLRPVNQQYPHKKNTSRFAVLSKGTAFLINRDNLSEFSKISSSFADSMTRKEFKNYVCYSLLETPKTNNIFYWSGYGLLKTYRLNAISERNSLYIFKNKVKFLGLNTARIGNSLKIDYFWQAEKPVQDIFVFAHFVQNDKIIAQNDHPLLEKFPKNELPRQNEIYMESYNVDNIPPGVYDVILGLHVPRKSNRRIKIINVKPNKNKITITDINL